MKLSEFIETKLAGAYWHTTSLERYRSILASGFVLAEPDIPESERYHPGFVRSLGGVSLFDFPIGFNLESYELEIPTNSLSEFVPFRPRWGRSVWLRVNVDLVAENLRSGREIRALWRTMGSSKRFIAEVEGAHLGDIPVGAIADVYHIGAGDKDWRALSDR